MQVLLSDGEFLVLEDDHVQIAVQHERAPHTTVVSGNIGDKALMSGIFFSAKNTQTDWARSVAPCFCRNTHRVGAHPPPPPIPDRTSACGMCHSLLQQDDVVCVWATATGWMTREAKTGWFAVRGSGVQVVAKGSATPRPGRCSKLAL